MFIIEFIRSIEFYQDIENSVSFHLVVQCQINGFTNINGSERVYISLWERNEPLQINNKYWYFILTM